MIITPNERLVELCKRSVDAWGVNTQLRLLQEECGECVAAVNHFYRNRPEAETALIIEIADVLLSAMQARSIIGEEAVNAAMKFKLDRLEERLKENGH